MGDKTLESELMACKEELKEANEQIEYLKYELEKNGYDVKQQVIVNLEYDDLVFDSNLKVDLLVNDCIVIELKSVDKLMPIHEAQLLTYMKILKKPQGLLINFNTINITSELIPLVNDFFKKLDEE